MSGDNRIPTPTLNGPRGKAWDTLAPLREWAKSLGIPAGCSTSAWIIHAPSYHPLWSAYELAAVHLRPMPGIDNAVIHIPGSSHQVFLWALSPGKPLADQIKLPTLRLWPMNFCGEFHARDDEHAAEIIEETVSLILAGVLSPDTDHTRDWVARFSASNLKGKEASKRLDFAKTPTTR